jgi:hypothetical protein
MKFHHAAAFALMCWYLMTPPVSTVARSDHYYRVVARAPLAQWERVGRFESGDDCNSYRVTVDEDLKQRHALDDAPNPSTGQAYQGTHAQAQQAAILYGRCIPSSDPHLKSN